MKFVTRRRGRDGWAGEDEDPLSGIANLFDVSVAFIVALLIALFGMLSGGRLLDPSSDVTIVQRSSSGDMQIIQKKGAQITVQKVTDKSMSGEGTRLGTAYRLANGQVVYVPEEDAAAAGAAGAGARGGR